MAEDLRKLYRELVAKEQLVPQYEYVRRVAEKFVGEGEFVRPWWVALVNDILSPLSQAAVLVGEWRRAAEKMSDDKYPEINIGVIARKPNIGESMIRLEVGIPSGGPSVDLPPLSQFKEFHPAYQFHTLMESVKWVNVLAAQFYPELLPQQAQA